MLPAKLLFLCTILALLSATTSVPVPGRDEMFVLAPVDKVKMEQPKESKSSLFSYLGGSGPARYQPGLKDTLVG